MPNHKLKLGIVGLGHVADHQLAALRIRSDSYEIVGICDRNPNQFAKVPGVPSFLDLSEMLKLCPMDALLISLPNVEHFEAALAAISHDISVLIEKPATESVKQFEELIHLANKKGIILHTALHAAFARDLLWFLEERTNMESVLGPITGIRCGFYDPYFLANGELSSAAMTLGGSWIDSGINALSVIDRILESFEIEEVRMTKVLYESCKQIQGSVDFTFSVNGDEACGQGFIDTNWTLGINRKTTELFFSRSNHRLKLDHSEQRVTLVNRRNIQTLADFSEDFPRLTTHYLGVFDDFHRVYARSEDNREASLKLLKKLYLADSDYA